MCVAMHVIASVIPIHAIGGISYLIYGCPYRAWVNDQGCACLQMQNAGVRTSPRGHPPSQQALPVRHRNARLHPEDQQYTAASILLAGQRPEGGRRSPRKFQLPHSIFQ